MHPLRRSPRRAKVITIEATLTRYKAEKAIALAFLAAGVSLRFSSHSTVGYSLIAVDALIY